MVVDGSVWFWMGFWVSAVDGWRVVVVLCIIGNPLVYLAGFDLIFLGRVGLMNLEQPI